MNEAFIIDKNTRDELIKEDPKSEQLIRPILRGKDIKRYEYDFKEIYLIVAHNGNKVRGIPPININNYPAIKEHLNKFLEKLKKRQDKGDTPYNLRNCVYMDEFSKPKIIYPDISANFAFAYDQSKMLINNTAYMITCDEEAKLKALFVILHSKLIAWYYGLISVQLGSQAVRMFSQYVEELPIVRAGEDGKISELFERLINEKDKALVQRALDEYVNSLYCLNKEESDFILSH